MAIEARSPPPQFALRLRRALGGRAGWNGVFFQVLFIAALIWLGHEIVANARANLAAQRVTSGFGFLANNAGFDVSQSLIPYSGSDSYVRVFFVGLLNTLLVAVVGIFFATIIGFAVALGRLSPNWLLSRIAGGYVELVRNLPLLFQLLFWYKAAQRRYLQREGIAEDQDRQQRQPDDQSEHIRPSRDLAAFVE